MPKSMCNLYIKFYLIPKYIKNSEVFGDMLSYSYMGEPIGFDKVSRKNLKYALKLIKLNIKPYDYNQMASVGWGHKLPKLENFSNEEEKQLWIAENLSDQLIIKEIQKTNFASKIYNLMKD